MEHTSKVYRGALNYMLHAVMGKIRETTFYEKKVCRFNLAVISWGLYFISKTSNVLDRTSRGGGGGRVTFVLLLYVREIQDKVSTCRWTGKRTFGGVGSL